MKLNPRVDRPFAKRKVESAQENKERAAIHSTIEDYTDRKNVGFSYFTTGLRMLRRWQAPFNKLVIALVAIVAIIIKIPIEACAFRRE